MKEYWLIGAVALVILGGLWVANTRTAVAPRDGGKACTMEAKLCPDGSYVGRTGSNCEFAECPTVTTSIAIGANATINGTKIGVLELLEDSRCPVDVQCIQAGTVRVRAAINALNKDFTFILDKSQDVGNATVTLASVVPAQKYSKKTVQLSGYRFTFTVVPKVAAVPPRNNSGVRGTVSLGPTCPVQRIPPDPQCADRPYATSITVRHTGSSSIVATGKSDAAGAFSFSLPPGAYTLTAGGSTMLPRCSPLDITVPATGYVTADISCDTGIR